MKKRAIFRFPPPENHSRRLSRTVYGANDITGANAMAAFRGDSYIVMIDRRRYRYDSVWRMAD
ncbi:hypothetical protein KCP73_05440 [Salmonella enterica subsp. enterica]|nr:hypothetical protein KCP73_05440 [Salmonella enterica subsp. enterica]